MRLLSLLGSQEFHGPFPVVVGEVLGEDGLHFVCESNHLLIKAFGPANAISDPPNTIVYYDFSLYN